MSAQINFLKRNDVEFETAFLTYSACIDLGCSNIEGVALPIMVILKEEICLKVEAFKRIPDDVLIDKWRIKRTFVDQMKSLLTQGWTMPTQ